MGRAPQQTSTHLVRVVVGVDEERLPLGGQRGGIDGEAVVLRRDERLTVQQIQHRLVVASVVETGDKALRRARVCMQLSVGLCEGQVLFLSAPLKILLQLGFDRPCETSCLLLSIWQNNTREIETNVSPVSQGQFVRSRSRRQRGELVPHADAEQRLVGAACDHLKSKKANWYCGQATARIKISQMSETHTTPCACSLVVAYLSETRDGVACEARISRSVGDENPVKVFFGNVVIPGHQLHLRSSLSGTDSPGHIIVKIKKTFLEGSVTPEVSFNCYGTKCETLTQIRFLIMLCLIPQSSARILNGFPFPNTCTSCTR